jgi:hypothetical protein
MSVARRSGRRSGTVFFGSGRFAIPILDALVCRVSPSRPWFQRPIDRSVERRSRERLVQVRGQYLGVGQRAVAG